MKNVSIATDISCDPEHEIATWACYIDHEGGTIQRSGVFKNFHSNTAAAETYALVNALTIAREEVSDWENSEVTIYNEIDYALRPVRTKAGNIRLRDKERSNAIQEIALPILQQAKRWEVEDVKAHYRYWKESGEEKYLLNRWVDQASRKLLKETRKKVLAI